MKVNKYESLEDALMFCIRASNKELKEVAAALWPSTPVPTSHGRLIEALNPKKSQKLTFDEIIFIMHLCGRYDPLYYMADQCLHERPAKICIEAEQKSLQETFANTLQEVTKAYQYISSITEQRDEIEKIRKGNLTLFEVERKVAYHR